MSGLRVLDELKTSLKTVRIPTYVISGMHDNEESLRLGAIGYLQKPTTAASIEAVFSRLEEVLKEGIKQVEVVESGHNREIAIMGLIEDTDVVAQAARPRHSDK